MTHHRFAFSRDEAAVRSLKPIDADDFRSPGRNHCAFCGHPLASTDDVLSFYERRDTDGPLWDRVTPRLRHRGCHPDEAERLGLLFDVVLGVYLLELDVYGRRAPVTLRERSWWSPTYEWELRHARWLARRLERDARPRAPRAITPTLRALILERDGFRCRRCGCSPADARLVIDHIVPVARGGSCTATNLQTLCVPCNQGKSDRPPHEHDLCPR